jgi:predicted SAM-dependent methyltransferase
MRVNIGCGTTPTSGWENFDNSWSLKLSKRPLLTALLYKLKAIDPPQMRYIAFCRENNINWADATRKIPLPDASVELLYSSHMLEHLDRDEARSFLTEARRVLKAGGTIRLAVPDLAKQIDAYVRNKDADEFIKATLMTVPRPRTWSERLRVLLVGTRHHQWMYDGGSLSRLLQDCGFANAEIIAAGETSITDPKPLDLRERESESLYVEAVKG